ncbi:polyketide synthase [Streptomyces chrestomyceticus JCM 4735]|uniref:Polyketide synthase n=1 Tax=Streptomyces chrestomyceticus JCM 4735 TaxID=1306181 RepID=A0A7U9Q3B6_9ACTN|nr:polyketide synthase [Streptomyces chrestomyceticus JCM 4735]
MDRSSGCCWRWPGKRWSVRASIACLAGRKVGVFTGITHDHGEGVLDAPGELEGFLGIGASGSVASGRIAYTLGLEGRR